MPRHAMRATWRDPDDVTPGARRTAREVNGWRRFCPLRRMSGHPNSGITVEHIMAADRLREQVDIATLGFTAARPLIYVAQYASPRWGMGAAAVRQMRAIREVHRVIWLFHPPQLVMLDLIVLRNVTLREWTKKLDPPSSALIEKRRLLVILDRLVQHFATDVADELARGKRLAP